jgi:hypothetical protein
MMGKSLNARSIRVVRNGNGDFRLSLGRGRTLDIAELNETVSGFGGEVICKKLHQGIARVVGKTGQCNVGTITDSLGLGTGAGSGGGKLVGAAPWSITSLMAAILNAQGIPAADNSFFGEHLFQGFAPSIQVSAWDSRFQWVGGASHFANGQQQSLGGIMAQLDAAGEGISFTPQVGGVNSNVDTALLVYCNRYTGTFDTTFAGGASLGAVTGSGATTLASVTKTFTRGVGALAVSRTAGNCVLVGGVLTDSQTPRVNFMNFGTYGDRLTTPSGIANNANEWRGGAALSMLGLDAVIVDMTVNSANIDGVAGLDAYKAALIQVCNDVVAAGADLILATPHATGGAGETNGAMALYVKAIFEVASSFGAPVIDLWNKLTPFSTYQTNMFAAADVVHLNGTGYGSKGMEWTRALREFASI